MFGIIKLMRPHFQLSHIKLLFLESMEIVNQTRVANKGIIPNNFVFSQFVAFFAAELTLKKRRNV